MVEENGIPASSQDSERGALERVLLANLVEQRRTRRWGILFKSLWFIFLFALLIMVASKEDGEFTTGDHTSLIELQGEIGSDSGVLADDIISALDSAFEDKKTKAVVLRCNSPGGSPVQAGQIYDEIRRLRGEHPKTPVYAVVDDVCASGGYYIIAAADKIFVDKASLVGSIGVLMDGFGFTGVMDKLGVERRLLTAGKNKGFLDPFSPVDAGQEAHAKAMLEEIHQQFIQVVRQGRGKRLKETDDMFSGLIWSGAASIDMGLSDGMGSLDYVAREVVKAEDIVDYTPQENLADRLARRLGTAVGSAVRPWMESGAHLR
ncbi:MAG: S49 family peptidase [Gallionellaceae bacterium]|nr:S49 family peptidase [Gallionellaceae bacterium]